MGLYLFSYLAPILKRNEIWSVPRALAIRYGQKFMLLSGVVIVLGTVGIFGVQLIAFGVVVVTLLPDTGVTYQEAVVVAAVVMVIYTALGGLLAVAYTDFVQTVIMVLGIGILLPILVVQDMGGVSAALAAIPPPDGDWLGGMTVFFVLAIFLVDVPFSLLDNSLWQRTGATKKISYVRRGVRGTAYAHLLWSLVVTALGVFAIQLLPGLEATEAGADAAVPLLVVEYMPVIVKGLCLAALLAVIMSTADTVLLIAGTTVSWDFYAALRPNADDHAKVRVARMTVFIAGAVGTVFALTVQGIFEMLLLAFAVYVATLFVPVMAAFFWRKATRQAAFASAAVAFIALAVLYPLKFAGRLPEIVEPIVVSMALGLVTMLAVSLATWSKETATIPLAETTAAENQ